MIKDVTITKIDTCWTYVVKRTNLHTKCKFAKDIEKYFDLIPYSPDMCYRGVIVLWNHNKKMISVPTEITTDVVLINHNVDINVHVGVIEDDDVTMVSDVTRKITENNVPCIRVRMLSDVRPPDFIIKQK